jgi:hypothetical protein
MDLNSKSNKANLLSLIGGRNGGPAPERQGPPGWRTKHFQGQPLDRILEAYLPEDLAAALCRAGGFPAPDKEKAPDVSPGDTKPVDDGVDDDEDAVADYDDLTPAAPSDEDGEPFDAMAKLLKQVSLAVSVRSKDGELFEITPTVKWTKKLLAGMSRSDPAFRAKFIEEFGDLKLYV